MALEADGRERELVARCLKGSRSAWNEFYGQFNPLVRKAVRSRVRLDPQQVDDMVQAVFLALVNDLQGYDARYPLSRFVWLVAQRVCIDEYRKSKAAKRDGEEIPVDHHDGSEAGAAMIASACPTQDRRLQDAEQQELLRASLEHLGEKCADLLRLRYREDLSFKEIADLLGANKKSLAVQAGRCIEELRVIYAQLERTGGKS